MFFQQAGASREARDVVQARAEGPRAKASGSTRAVITDAGSRSNRWTAAAA